jgi:hypothetical protein
MLMRLATRIGTVFSAAAMVLVSVAPTWAQSSAPAQRPGAVVAGEVARAGAGPGAQAGVIAFTGADFMVGLMILATLILFGWAALASGRHRAVATQATS